MDNFIRELFIDWNKIDEYSYLRDIEAIKNLESLSFNKKVTFFQGENGSGKSSLLEAIAISFGFNPEGGTKNYNFSSFDSHSDLSHAIKLIKGVRKPAWGYFLRAESFYNLASKELEYQKVFSDNLHERSHGEAFLKIFERNFERAGLYILDEPEAALSVQSQLRLMLEIKNSIDLGSQFIIASHSPILLAMPDSEIYSFDGDRVELCDYQDTSSYKLTKAFIESREAFIHRLFEG